MAIPSVIEIVPLAAHPGTPIVVPGSKSITNRALILGALGSGTTRLEGALWSDDTQVMVDSLAQLGFQVSVAKDPLEACNRTLTITGRGGEVPNAGTERQPLELFVGNAGTAARFLTALVCLGRGVYRLSGVRRMHERPQAALFEALRQLGYRVEALGNRLPATIYGSGPRPGRCTVSIAESSQFASALLLGASRGGWQVQVTDDNADESPYVAMTTKLATAFPRNGGIFGIEPDASSGSYFWAASELTGGTVRGGGAPVVGWPASDWQVDSSFPRFLPLPLNISRQSDLGDSILTAMVLAPFCDHPVRFTDLGRLRLQECERVAAMRTELTRCGASVDEQGDCLTVHPAAMAMHGADIETYDDHRIAMCFATLGLKIPGLRLHNPSCVKKTFPNFFQKLATKTPDGLGAEIRDPRTGRVLAGDELFAD